MGEEERCLSENQSTYCREILWGEEEKAEAEKERRWQLGDSLAQPLQA